MKIKKNKFILFTILFLFSTSLFCAEDFETMFTKSVNPDSEPQSRLQALTSTLVFVQRAPKALDLTKVMRLFYQLDFEGENLENIILISKILSATNNFDLLGSFLEYLTRGLNENAFVGIIEALVTFDIAEHYTPTYVDIIKNDFRPVIEKHLSNSKLEIKQAAAMALSIYGDEASARKLISLLSIENDQMRGQIVASVIDIGSTGALSECIEENNPATIKWCSEALSTIEKDRKVARLNILAKNTILDFLESSIYDPKKVEEKELVDRLGLEHPKEVVPDPVMLELGNFTHGKLLKVHLSSEAAIICERSFSFYLFIKEDKLDGANLSEVQRKHDECLERIVEKEITRAKYYLSWGRRDRDKNSPKAAIPILEELLTDRDLGVYHIDTVLMLAHAHLLLKDKPSALAALAELTPDKMSKRQLRKFKKYSRAANKKSRGEK
ncbi:MAG: hypothetical protein HOE90_02390 [Bacteriovoracaceae bacterium]|jgi:hypothetical protein|nr:hypothetical protein [Bacteriovoracaceae bacterium]